MTNAPGRTACAVESLEPRQLLTNFVVSTVADSGPGSLRQAILDANNTPGTDAIHFAIGDGGTATIKPLSALPDVGSSVAIDGTTQPGFAGKPLIEISGELATPWANGLRLFGGSVGPDATVVRGLAINRFAGAGLFINGVGVRVEGCYIGADLSGDAPARNGQGMYLWGTQHTIGGTVVAARNVISGNALGIGFGSGSAEGIRIQGNYIGTNASGTAAIPNEVGISLANGGVTIGAAGGYEQGGNLISGNVRSAIRISGGHYNLPVSILNNRIGTSVNGVALGAGSAGVVVTNNSGRAPSPVIITGNEIAFADAGGIAIGPSEASTRVLARGNFLHSNRHAAFPQALNIDLGGPGADVNDPNDADAGANDLLNAPVLTGFGGTAIRPTAVGTYHGLPSTSLVLDVYRVGTGWRGEPVGSATITTDASGNASFEIPLNANRSDGGAIEATASLLDAVGDGGVTSESSAVLPMGGGAINGVVQVSGVNAAGRVVYVDRNNNNVLEADERRVTTNGDGFRFDGLAPGRYHLRQVVPAGEVQTQPITYNNSGWPEPFYIDISGTQVATVTFATTVGPVLSILMPSLPSVSPGQTLTLRASATPGASGRAVEAVRFYRESNGTSGLQVGAGGDALLAQQTTPINPASSLYEAPVALAALAGGDNTFYAQATDVAGAVSNVTQKGVRYRDDLAMIKGAVFVDTNGDGIRGPGEDAKVNGTVVFIDRNTNDRFDAGDLQSGTSAATDGLYTFASLPAGTHRIGLFRPTGDYVQTSPADFGLLTVTVAPGQVLTGADFLVKSQPLAFVTTPTGGGPVAVREGSTAGFSLSLNRRPWTSVSVSDVVRLANGDGDLQLESSVPIIFTPDNWNVPQAVTFRAAQDADLTSDSATFRFSAAEIATPLEIVVTEVDDDPAVPVTYQAELGTFDGTLTAFSTRNKNYTGSGYLDFGTGSASQLIVDRPAHGLVQMTIRYANGSSADRPFTVFVGERSVGTLSAPPTGGGSIWATSSIDVALMSGPNVVRFVAVGAGADLDSVTITPLTTTPPTGDDPPITLQGEAATLAGGTTANAANRGYTGSGYADFAGAGSSAQFAVTRTAAGAATLAIRYANGSMANRPYDVLVNGIKVGQFTAIPTGAGSTWRTELLGSPVPLAAGSNAIRLVAVGAGADLDQLTVTATTTTTPPPPPPADPALVTLQGESATLGGGTAANSANRGYSGSGYADFAGAGSWAQFTVTRVAAGPATLAIRYANGSTANRPFNVLVNGVAVGQFACPPTGSGSTWSTLSLSTSVSLLAGSNTVRLVAVGAGADLDQLTITAV